MKHPPTPFKTPVTIEKQAPASPPDTPLSSLMSLIGQALGWAYVVCWGVSLYPPIILNKRTKSVEGVSVDTVYLNLLGCIFYLTSVTMLYFSPIVRIEYALRHGGDAYPLINLNDVVYAGHSLLCVLTIMWQLYFSGYERSKSQHLSRGVKILSLVGLLGAGALLVHAWEINNTRRHYELVDAAMIFGSTKLFLSAIKYVPQAYWNFQRKSVKGFSLLQPVLDILGSVFCILQLWLDAYLVNDLHAMLKNPVKLFLALETIIFGLVFLIQGKIYGNEEASIYNKRL